MGFKIFADASIDIDKKVFMDNDISIVPMNYTLGDEDRVCEKLEDDDILMAFYNGQKNGDVTQTSQITPHVYMELFEPYLKEGTDVIYISLSSGLTKTFDNVNLAKEELEETYKDAHIYPVDSLQASGGMGLITEIAIKQRSEGRSAREVADYLNSINLNTVMEFMVDDLNYLKRGGRLKASEAFFGTMLGVKPIIFLGNDGTLRTIDKKRGEKQALHALLDHVTWLRDAAMPARVFITHGNCLERAKNFKAMLLEADPSLEVSIRMISPIIGAHTGPGSMMVAYWGDRTKVQ